MIIGGFQKLTLLDYPGKTACTVFTVGCNLRCPFCHNSSLVLGGSGVQHIEEEEVFDYLNKRRGLLDGVCITGGEPLLMNDIDAFCSRIKSLGYSVKLDTNGFYPEKLKQLIADGLCDYVAMDVKNTPSKYGETVGVSDIDVSKPLESIEFLKSCGIDHEFRTTVAKTLHTQDDIVSIARLLGEGERYFIQPFIDSGALIGDGIIGFATDELKSIIGEVKKVLPTASLRGI